MPADLNGVKVLIVDDNATNREILACRLGSWGMRVSEDMDAPAALQTLYLAAGGEARDPFQLAVIDMQMPGMDGASLGRAIRADKRLADIRMILLTSMGAQGEAQHFQDIGFSAYLSKPIHHEELKDVLSQALAGQAGAQIIVPPAPARTTEIRFAGRHARILLVEDNVINQKVAMGILSNLGLGADIAGDGAQAVEAIQSASYDLVLMDVQMPVMGGCEATSAIRSYECEARKESAPLIIIAMTAGAMEGDHEKCLEAGMNDYISKPVSARALADILDRWLPHGSDGPAATSPAATSPETDEKLDLPILDWAEMLDRLGGDRGLARNVAAGFLRDTPRLFDELRRHLVAGDVPATERLAHTIKSAAAIVGGERLRAVAFEAEQSAHAGDLPAIISRMCELDAEFARLTLEMEKEQKAQ
jgi:CheY-like chemotaxis protein/HPt (histidine-containing phosphotransfer) domain-containing protein